MKKRGLILIHCVAWLSFGCSDLDSQTEGLDVLESEVQTAQQAIRTDPDPAADGVITLEEIEAIAREYGVVLETPVLVDSVPEGAIPLEPTPLNTSDTCTTGVNQPAETSSTTPIRRISPRGDYSANFSPNTHRTIPPKTIRGGSVQEFPPNPPEIIILQDSYRAAGCANDARVNDPSCRNHPYRRALDEELALDATGHGNPHRP